MEGQPARAVTRPIVTVSPRATGVTRPRSPRPLAVSAIAAVTLLSTPIDVIFGRLAVQQSWHAVFVLEHVQGGQHAR